MSPEPHHPHASSDSRAEARGSIPAADAAFDAEVLEKWRITGRVRVAQHWAELEDLVERIGPLIEARRYQQAALAAQVAANHAVLWHAGVFVHPKLESLLRRLGEAALPAAGSARAPGEAGPLKILHIATNLTEIGGHGQMMSRWIRHDGGNLHSLALTRQIGTVPAKLRDAVEEAGGEIHRLNVLRGGLLEWGRALQDLIARADLVILHVHSMDVIPMLAIAGLRQRPPVALINHADHLFWLGAGFVDQVISSRDSGSRLTIERRGVGPDRNTRLPLCIEPSARSRSREEAKRQLGIPADCVLILTLARALKFPDVDGTTFADTLVPVLLNNPNARFIAVGPGGSVDWSGAQSRVPDRIDVIAETTDTRLYLEAADIYVDSFPFVSITSLSEAGLYGVPLVTRTAFPADCAVMAADSPAFDNVLLRSHSLAEFGALLDGLVRDPPRRIEIGERTREAIASISFGEGWKRDLAAAYRRLGEPRRRELSVRETEPQFGDIDLFTPQVFGHPTRGATPASRLAFDIELVIKAAPLGWRVGQLARFARQGQLGLFGVPAWRLLIPEWLGSRIRAARSRRTQAPRIGRAGMGSTGKVQPLPASPPQAAGR